MGDNFTLSPKLTRTLLYVSFAICTGIILLIWTSGYFNVPPSDRQLSYLASTATVWDHESFTKHGFLPFLTLDDFEHGKAYTHHSLPFLLGSYLLLKVTSLIGMPYDTGQNCILLVYLALIIVLSNFAVDLIRSKKIERAQFPLPYLVLIPISVFILTAFPPLWIGLLRFNRDNLFIIPSLGFMGLSIVDRYAESKLGYAMFFLLVTVLFAPFYVPLALLTYAVLTSETNEIDHISLRKRILNLLILLCVGLVILLLPRAGIFLTGLRQETGSSFLFRSGLDGDTTYFTSIIQAVIHPFREDLNRPWHAFCFPIIALSILFWVFFIKQEKNLAMLMSRQWMVTLIPYLYPLVILPQAVSIHPYLFDFSLMFGAIFCIFCWILDGSLLKLFGSISLISFTLVLFGGLMTELLDLARFFR